MCTRRFNHTNNVEYAVYLKREIEIIPNGREHKYLIRNDHNEYVTST